MLKFYYYQDGVQVQTHIGNLTNNVSNAEFDCAETQQLFYNK